MGTQEFKMMALKLFVCLCIVAVQARFGVRDNPDQVDPDKFCGMTPEKGPCRARNKTRYFFNPVTRRCNRFRYGGCAGNENKFKTYATCMGWCQRAEVSYRDTMSFLSQFYRPRGKFVDLVW